MLRLVVTCTVQHLGVDSPEDEPLRVAVWHRMIERYIETTGFDSWTHLHPTFYMEVSQHYFNTTCHGN